MYAIRRDQVLHIQKYNGLVGFGICTVVRFRGNYLMRADPIPAILFLSQKPKANSQQLLVLGLVIEAGMIL